MVNTIFKISLNLFDLTTPFTSPLPAYRVAADNMRLKNTQINDSFIGGAIKQPVSLLFRFFLSFRGAIKQSAPALVIPPRLSLNCCSYKVFCLNIVVFEKRCLKIVV